MKICPYCESQLSDTATKCKQCGEWYVYHQTESNTLKNQSEETNTSEVSRENKNNDNGAKKGYLSSIGWFLFFILLLLDIIVVILFINTRNSKQTDIKQEIVTEQLPWRGALLQCTGYGIDGEINSYAECSTGSLTYSGEIKNHNFNGNGVFSDSELNFIMDGYFISGDLKFGNYEGRVDKINFNEEGLFSGEKLYYGFQSDKSEAGVSYSVANKGGSAIVRFDSNNGYSSFYVNPINGKGNLFGKIYDPTNPSNVRILMGNLDGELKLDGEGYMHLITNDLGNIFGVGEYKNGKLYNGFIANDAGCMQYTNGVGKEITRTITRTVYSNPVNNIVSSPLGNYYAPGGKGNPYNVNVTFK